MKAETPEDKTREAPKSNRTVPELTKQYETKPNTRNQPTQNMRTKREIFAIYKPKRMVQQEIKGIPVVEKFGEMYSTQQKMNTQNCSECHFQNSLNKGEKTFAPN